MARGNSYTKEFKEEAVRLTVNSGKSVGEVAKDLGISLNTLHDWRRQARLEHRLPVPDNETLAEENKRLRRELELVREERDVIKKAIAYFTQPPKK